MTSKTNTFIEINGKRYDAHSGQPFGAANKPARSIDGITRQPSMQIPSQAAKPKPAQAPTPTAKQSHTAASHGRTQHPQPSKTLMRQTVKKPPKSHGSNLRIQTRTDILALQPDISVEPKLSVSSIDDRRVKRAKHVTRSQLVSRFGTTGLRPVILGTSQPETYLPVTGSLAPTRVLRTLKPPTASRSMDIFQKALSHAASHEQKPSASKKRAKRTAGKTHRMSRIASVSSAALAVVVLGGFFALQNIANVTVRMASAKAGFAASLPGYRPAGFSVGKFAYSPGSVTINFHSNSDERSFALTEKPSSWDSDSLLNEYVAAQGSNYQTVQTAGRTLYIYGSNNATWVNNGVWYQVTNNDSLSTSQLTSVASSM